VKAWKKSSKFMRLCHKFSRL